MQDAERKKNGTWISVQLSTVNGTEVGDQECRYTLFLHYGVDLPYPPPNKYDGCWAQLSIAHNLDCKKVNLVTTDHNELCGRVDDLYSKAFTPLHV